jgi:hypothetical protein
MTEEANAKREKETAALAAEVENDKKARQAAQQAGAEKLRLSVESTAISLAKAEAEREAAQVAQRRKLQEKADRLVRSIFSFPQIHVTLLVFSQSPILFPKHQE